MGLFGLSRKEKETWASIVIQGIKPDMQVDDVLLKNATESYICQHIRILEESVRLVLESKNNKTREDRYELALQHFSALSKIRKYADKNQKKRQEKQKLKRLKRDPFLEAYGTMEILDDISMIITRIEGR